MKTAIKIVGLAVAAAVIVAGGLAFGIGVAEAQGPAGPMGPAGFGPGQGQGGMMGGYGLMAGYRDQMHAAIAKALGMSVDDFNAALASGKTAWQIAQEKGFSAEQFRAAMLQARSEVLAQAVKDGTLTQAQADAMLGHMKQGAGQGNGPGAGPHFQNCPYFNAP